jgi:hypothetical protein
VGYTDPQRLKVTSQTQTFLAEVESYGFRWRTADVQARYPTM